MNLIEKVADAISDKLQGVAERGDGWIRSVYIEAAARAAIEAMREPISDALGDSFDTSSYDLISNIQAKRRVNYSLNRMIDAALKED